MAKPQRGREAEVVKQSPFIESKQKPGQDISKPDRANR